MLGVGLWSEGFMAGILAVGPGEQFSGYPTIVDTLVSQKSIPSRAFSLDLRSIDSPDGRRTLSY
jgi:hypothetical protein